MRLCRHSACRLRDFNHPGESSRDLHLRFGTISSFSSLDIDNTQERRRLREIYYDQGVTRFAWPWADTVRGHRRRVAAVHEAVTASAMALRTVRIKTTNNSQGSPLSVMNALYAAPFRLDGSDNGGISPTVHRPNAAGLTHTKKTAPWLSATARFLLVYEPSLRPKAGPKVVYRVAPARSLTAPASVRTFEASLEAPASPSNCPAS